MIEWFRETYPISLYEFFALFAMYSMIGWLVESIYMSLCNKRLTNRGFGKGPFCPIYGVGALGAYFLFTPIRGKYVLIYVLGCIIATTFEYLVGRLMKHFLGEIWWDYHNKPFNFQGIICLESTLAWGIYALVIVHILTDWMLGFLRQIDKRMGLLILGVIYFLVFVDYLVQFANLFGLNIKFADKLVQNNPEKVGSGKEESGETVMAENTPAEEK